MRSLFFIVLFFLFQQFNYLKGQNLSDFTPSTAGFHKLKDVDARLAFGFNNGWRFYKGDVKDAWKKNFNAEGWEQVQLPHGIEILPREASGGINYQGVVWYRKKFSLPKNISNKLVTLHFEAIMGKCQIWINGVLVKEHKGGYLPIIFDLDKKLLSADNNVIAVRADNSDDPSYPIGKPQYEMDFAYFGGIYRDVWIVATENVFITDANQVDKKAGGGIFVHYENVSEQKSDVIISTDVQNSSNRAQTLQIENQLLDESGQFAAKEISVVNIPAGQSQSAAQKLQVQNCKLWSPETPYLYKLVTTVKNESGKVIDGYYQYIGIRTFEFRGTDGFYLNGKPYAGKLMGFNRHQDYALIGNALSNNLHWQDAKLMKDAGATIVRGSHYPQDPAFMDACDRLGIFIISCIPGWQFWNPAPSFEEYVIRDIRNMIRRDRNRPCVLLWEPLLNETAVLGKGLDLRQFTINAYNAVHEEYPFKDCYAATDVDHNLPETNRFDVFYSHPNDIRRAPQEILSDKSFFTREWGETNDDFYAHNAVNRVALGWGETPQLLQASQFTDGLGDPRRTSWERIYRHSRQLVGGDLWHFFDTERGYHPDPFYGGVVDNFRQKKYSYYLFRSQMSPESNYFKISKQNPFILEIAHAMTPWSPEDVTVFTNCDSVQLISFGKDTLTLAPRQDYKMPHPPIVFKNMYSWNQLADLTWGAKTWEVRYDSVYLLAKGYYKGKVVAEQKRVPSFRPEQIKLSVEENTLTPLADGGTIIPVKASVLDAWGTVKRLNNSLIKFTVLGEGVLVNGHEVLENPKKVEWGTAVALVRTSLKPGVITIIAEPYMAGETTLRPDTITITSIQPRAPLIYNPAEVTMIKESRQNGNRGNLNQKKMSADEMRDRLRKVDEEQKKFGERKQ